MWQIGNVEKQFSQSENKNSNSNRACTKKERQREAWFWQRKQYHWVIPRVETITDDHWITGVVFFSPLTPLIQRCRNSSIQEFPISLEQIYPSVSAFCVCVNVYVYTHKRVVWFLRGENSLGEKEGQPPFEELHILPPPSNLFPLSLNPSNCCWVKAFYLLLAR